MKKKTKAAAPTKAVVAKAAGEVATQSTAAPAALPEAPRKAAAPPAKPAKPAKPAADPKAEKPRKPKLVRDSFTIPKDEYAVLDALKQRAAGLGRPTKKSEVLRAGVQALAAMPDSAFLAAVGGVPALKTGRPAKT